MTPEIKYVCGALAIAGIAVFGLYFGRNEENGLIKAGICFLTIAIVFLLNELRGKG